MLTFRRLLRSRLELNSGTAHVFRYIMDEHMNFWCHPMIMSSHGSDERAKTIFEFWIQGWTEKANHNTMKRFEAFNQWKIRR